MAFSTDTRTLQPGDTYVAIRGETHDGHAFVPQALAKGAAALIVEEPVEAPADVDVTEVASSIDHLVALASTRVRQLGCRTVAITGSVGKTTARTAVVAVLSQAFTVKGSEGNKNTPLGLSLTLLNADLTPETVLVLEMGARLSGDIKELCAAFPPTVGVVTNVRGVHLETLGSLDGVEREKSEIVRALDADGTAVLNGDDDRARRMASVTAGSVVLYGTSSECDVRPEHVTADLPILGDHAVYTAMLATAVGRAFEMDDATITRGLEAIESEKGRLRKLPGRGGSTLVDDTYNASPDATRSALDVLAGLDAERRTAILGDMLELGESEVQEHVAVLRHALQQADRVWAVESPYTIMGRAVAALADGERQQLELFASSHDAALAVRDGRLGLGSGDAVLVKGSQGARMERVSEAVLAPDLDPAAVLARQTEQWKAIE
ncbi:UDP-N-acetylmuramoyl-tripeptide--D-alanyl-D-alanine ligase [Rubrivirga sp. IMCC45206]|uniref:UDP-N-acetylmuramoyl-tripeptide--D-alanyl-D- alanine ligase n=1 Tax=Rubrivirga sp. IMCC45206 TaxID=3391614 RepID=UPI00398F9867